MSVCFPVEINLELIYFFLIVDQSQLILTLGKRTDVYRMLSKRFRFLSELGRDAMNIDDMRIAGEKLAVVYSKDIEEHWVGSELLEFSNFVKLCVDEKQGDEAHEAFMHRLIQEKNLISLFPNIAIILRICLCLNVLKQQWWNVIFETETDKERTQVINVTATFKSFVADEYWERAITETKLLQAHT